MTPTQMRLNLHDLAPGRCTLQVRIAGDPQPLASITGLKVGRGAVQDLRLSAIDLRGRLRLACVQVADDGGGPLRGDGQLLLADPAGGIHWVQLHDGAFAVPLATQPVHATIRVQGFRLHELPALDGDCTVQLARALELRVRLAALPALPDGVELRAFAQPRGEPKPIFGPGQPANAQPEPGRFEFALAETGAYELAFALTRRDGRSAALRATPDVVEVTAAANAPGVVCTADDADVQAALRELQR
jgi:hypothetical protein